MKFVAVRRKPEGREFKVSDPVAEDCVIQAIRNLVSQGKRPYVRSVPEGAAALLEVREGAKVSASDAWDRVILAIESLQDSKRIECHNEPTKDWKILNGPVLDDAEIREAAKNAVLDTIEELTAKSGKRAHALNVPLDAAKLLKLRMEGHLTLNEAEIQVNLAIEDLKQAGKIASPVKPHGNWTVVS